MSNISSSYDAIVTRLGVLFPNHLRMHNPYNPELNPESVLNKGYGIQMLSGVNTERNLSCLLSISRTIVIVLTRNYFSKELDTLTKASVEKTLLEDQFILIKDLEKDSTVNASSYITTFKYSSDSGIQSVFTDKNSFIKIETNFSLEYFEDLN